MTFEQLQLAEPLLQALRAEGYTTPTPIQAQAIPPALEGHDLLGCAQTGTGKTAAFALPLLHRLYAQREADPRTHQVQARHPQRIHSHVRALVLAPTRELAAQIGESVGAYGRHTGLRHTVVYGGVGLHGQIRTLQRGVEVLVATPGRLLDLVGQRAVDLSRVEVLVLDEADRMLDMGFIHDIRRIIKLMPTKRQTLFFSATMPPAIRQLADELLTDPVSVAVAPVASTTELVEQQLYYVARDNKKALLLHLLDNPEVGSALVFTRTKFGADKLVKSLDAAGIEAEAIHGNKSQGSRQSALRAFKNGHIRVLVATDIAARGIDVDQLAYVVNFDLPNQPETYVHRIGRTGRAGASGLAVSFCDAEERSFLREIRTLIQKEIPVIADHPFASTAPAPVTDRPRGGQSQGQGSRNGGGRSFSGQRSGGRSYGGGQGGAPRNWRAGRNSGSARRDDR